MAINGSHTQIDILDSRQLLLQFSSALVMSLIVVGNALACAVPRPGTFVSLYELTPRSGHITLARVECDDDVEFENCAFNDIEVLRSPPTKGYRPWSWRLMPLRESETWLHSDFIRHSATEFWEEEVGRSPFLGCLFQHDFEPGQTYLMFYDMPAASASAELILAEDDAWLVYVREQVAVSNFLHMPLAEVNSPPMNIDDVISNQEARGYAIPAYVSFSVKRTEEVLYGGYSEWLLHSRSEPDDPANLTIILAISRLESWLEDRKLSSIELLQDRLVRVAGMLDRRESARSVSLDSPYGRSHILVNDSDRILILD